MFLIFAVILISDSVINGVAQPQIDTFKVKPERCYDTDELTELRCCIFPPFFEQYAARECGALKYHLFTDDQYNITGIRRDIFGKNNYWRCILNKYKLLNDEDNLHQEKYFSYLDKWASYNNDFTNILITAKMFCLDVYRYRMPIKIHEFFEFQNCIRNYVTLDCPVIKQTKECFKWKEFYEECREFYI